jgi:hypothetical protein
MTTATQDTLFGASEKQVKFINDLLVDREMEDEVRSGYKLALTTMDKKAASKLIDLLLSLPKAATKVPAAAGKPSLQEALSKAPKSKYAIPVEELDIALNSTPLNGDLLFLEIREYMNNLYMRRLTGSVGGFTRWKVANDDAVTLVNIIAQDPYKYTKIFGQHYSCCGSCGAELTDPISRELQLGPECRKKFGK